MHSTFRPSDSDTFSTTPPGRDGTPTVTMHRTSRGRTKQYWHNVEALLAPRKATRVGDLFQWKVHPHDPHPRDVVSDVVRTWRELLPKKPAVRTATANSWTTVATPHEIRHVEQDVLKQVPAVPLDDPQCAFLLKECRNIITRARTAKDKVRMRAELSHAEEALFTVLLCKQPKLLAQYKAQAQAGGRGAFTLLTETHAATYRRSCTALLGCFASAGDVARSFVLYSHLRRAGVADSPVYLDMLSAVSVAANKHAVYSTNAAQPLRDMLSITFDSLWGGVALSPAFYHLLLQNALRHDHMGMYWVVLRDFNKKVGILEQPITPSSFPSVCHLPWALCNEGKPLAALRLLEHIGATGLRHPPAYYQSARVVLDSLMRAEHFTEAEALCSSLAHVGQEARFAAAMLRGYLWHSRAVTEGSTHITLQTHVEKWLLVAQGLGDQVLWGDAVEACASREVLSFVEQRLPPDVGVLCDLKRLDRYASFGMILQAEQLAAKLLRASNVTVVYSSLLAGYAQLGDRAGVVSTIERLSLSDTVLHRGSIEATLEFVANDVRHV